VLSDVSWIPAFAGMTNSGVVQRSPSKILPVTFWLITRKKEFVFEKNDAIAFFKKSLENQIKMYYEQIKNI